MPTLPVCIIQEVAVRGVKKIDVATS